MRGQLVGRDEEVSRLVALLGDAASPALLLRGETGLGKTALLDELAAAADGFRVVRCAGAEAERDLAFAGLHQLLFPLLPGAAGLDPGHRAAIEAAFTGTAGATPQVMALGIAVLDLLTLVSAGAPLLLVVDDGQWLDVPSAQVLAFTARRLGGTAVRVAVAVRAEVPSALDGAGLRELLLEPLDEPSAARLLDLQRAGLSPYRRNLILRTAAGNPLALIELPRAEEVLDTGAIALPRRLERVYGARLRGLAAGERGELLRAALDGAGAGVARRAGAVRYRMGGVGGAVEAGLLAPDPATGEPVFRHPLVRSAVVQAATPNERRAAHADLAMLHRDSPERRAVHLAAATVDPDDGVAAALEEAAVSATRRGGAATAVTWLTRAAELSRRSADRSRRLADAAFVAGQAGLLDVAQDLAEDAAADGPAAVINAGFVALYRDGEVAANHRRISALVESGIDDDQLRERALTLLLAISRFAADPVRWARTDALFDRYGDRVGPSTAIARDAWGDLVGRGHGVPERIAEVLAGPAPVAPWDVMRLAVSAFYLGALGDHRALLRRTVEREAESGAVTSVMTLLQMVMQDQIGTGAWAEAEQTGRRGLDLTGEHGYALFAHSFRAFLGLLAAYRGDLDRARELQAAVDAWGRPRSVGFLTEYAEAIGAAAALSEGDYETAYAYAAGITAPGGFARYSQQAVRTLLDLVEAAVHTGRHEAARAHAEAARDAGLPALSPRLALLTAGALAITAGQDEAGALYAAAVAHPAGAAFPFELARIRLAYGAWLRRARELTLARQALTEAAGAFDRLGAATWAERARTELRAAGRPTRADRDAVAALTAQERQIAELAATGLSNREIGARLFLSPRTVGAHLYKVFPKLGITSRASLRDALGTD
ncbi:helix-turn-helix transcriptional regulator [Phytohabitans suffuscus]|uniref:LuxR family transcriptional regulator n=1 Tax=Phytohabitans suffuscus TaxID=624315 RepID=A0A6F8Z0P3_9ACTN|nr:LuxR family transcriptional regulator [Phytohabitans suffuscus]BCB92000.1 LuxR family transcriptional regulator [Phytohabitans suffuscus]